MTLITEQRQPTLSVYALKDIIKQAIQRLYPECEISSSRTNRYQVYNCNPVETDKIQKGIWFWKRTYTKDKFKVLFEYEVSNDNSTLYFYTYQGSDKIVVINAIMNVIKDIIDNNEFLEGIDSKLYSKEIRSTNTEHIQMSDEPIYYYG
jgi:hypothetical protein